MRRPACSSGFCGYRCLQRLEPAPPTPREARILRLRDVAELTGPCIVPKAVDVVNLKAIRTTTEERFSHHRVDEDGAGLAVWAVEVGLQVAVPVVWALGDDVAGGPATDPAERTGLVGREGRDQPPFLAGEGELTAKNGEFQRLTGPVWRGDRKRNLENLSVHFSILTGS